MESLKCCVSIKKSSNSIPNGFFEDLGKIVDTGAAVVHFEGHVELLFTPHVNVDLFVKNLHGNYIGDMILDVTFSCKDFHTHNENDPNRIKVKLQSVISDWEPKIMENVRKNLLQGLNFTCYKTVKCGREKCDIMSCIFYHSDIDKRRNPLNIPYLKKTCHQRSCIRGEKCRFSHNMFESMLHPKNMYKEPCSRSREKCFLERPLCLEAHKDSPELFFNPDWKDMLVTGTAFAFQYLAGAVRRFSIADPLFKNCRIFFMGYTEEFLRTVQNAVAHICHMHNLYCAFVEKDELERVVFGTPEAFNKRTKHIQLLSFNVVIVSQLNLIMTNEEAKTAMVQFLKQCNHQTQPPYIQKLFVADAYDRSFKSELEHFLGESIHMPSGDPESIIAFKFDVPHNPMKGHPFWLPAKSKPDFKVTVEPTDEEISKMKKASKPSSERNNSPASFFRTEECFKKDGQNDSSLHPYQDSRSSKRSRAVNSANDDVGSSLLVEEDLEMNRLTLQGAKRRYRSSWDSTERSGKKQRTSSGNNIRTWSPRPKRKRSKPSRSRKLRRNRNRLKFQRTRRSRSRSSRLRSSRSRSISSRSPRSKRSRSISSRSLKYLQTSSRSLSFRRNCEKSSSPSPLPVNRSNLVPNCKSNSFSPKRFLVYNQMSPERAFNSPSSETSATEYEKILKNHVNEAETHKVNTQVQNRLSHMMEISSGCYNEDSLLKQLGEELFKKFVRQEREICVKLDEEFEVYRAMPDMYDKYEECYGNFMKKYMLKFPDEDEEHKDRLWTAFWKSKFEYVRKCELERRISTLVTEYANKSSCIQTSVSSPSVPIAPSTSNSAEVLRNSVLSASASNIPSALPIVSLTNSSSLSFAVQTPFPPPAPNNSFASSPANPSSSVLPSTCFSDVSPFVSFAGSFVSSVKYKSVHSVPALIPTTFSSRTPSPIPASVPIPFPPPTIARFPVPFPLPAPFPPPVPSITSTSFPSPPATTTTHMPFPPPPPLSTPSRIFTLDDTLSAVSAPVSIYNSLTIYSQPASIPTPASLKPTAGKYIEKPLLENRKESILSESNRSSFQISSRTPSSFIADDATKNNNTQCSSVSNIINELLKQCRSNVKDCTNVPKNDADPHSSVQRTFTSLAETAQDSATIKSNLNELEKIARSSLYQEILISRTPSSFIADDATKNVNSTQCSSITNTINEFLKQCRSDVKDCTNVLKKDADLHSSVQRTFTSLAETAQDSATIKSNPNESEKIARSSLAEEILISENALEALRVIKTKTLKKQDGRRKMNSEGIEYDVEKTLALLKIVVPDMGIFGHGIASMLEKVKDFGNTTKEALKMFTESENVAILEMGLKKIKSKCISEGKVTFFDILEKNIRNLLEYAKQAHKVEKRLNVEAIANATINQDNSAIIDMIRNVALYQGLELDNKEVNEMFLQICSLHLKKSISKVLND